MILHNQQAVPRLQIHRFFHDYLRNFCIEFWCFFMFFRYRFRDWFLITFLMENGSKMASKIDPWGNLFRKKCSKVVQREFTGVVLEPTFFRAAIFQCFWVPFRRPFGQCWALLAPFWPLLAPCWALLAPFWEHFGRSWLNFARNKYNLESIFAGGFFTKNLVAKRKNN